MVAFSENLSAIANRLYPSTAVAPSAAPAAPAPTIAATPAAAALTEPQAAAPAAPPPQPEPASAATSVPAAIAELRQSDSKLHDPVKTFAPDLPDDGSLPGADVVEWRRVAGDVGADPQDVRSFRLLAKVHLAEPADDATVAGWRLQAQTLIKDRGFNDVDLEAARRLVARDPRVAEMLDRTGLGSHPQVVERFITLARAQRVAGRLK